MEVFDGAGRGDSVDGLIPAHLSPRGNRLVAEHLHRRLRSLSIPQMVL